MWQQSRLGFQAGVCVGGVWLAWVAALAWSWPDLPQGPRTVLAAGAVVAGMLGAILGALMVQAVRRSLHSALLISDTVASGDLSQDFETEVEGEFGALLGSLGRMEDKLTDLVERLQGTVEKIHGASDRIAADASSLASRTADQAASLEQTAASVEELTSSVEQTARRSRDASQKSVETAAVAERGGQLVHEVVQSMEAISSSSQKIGDIIGVIEGIAFQTNMLALNAAVEAARAGEQGRGFAVVAGEVRVLARRSAESAKEIKGLIDNAVAQVQLGVARVSEAGSTMDQIVTGVALVRDQLTAMSSALSQQSTGVGHLNEAVAHIDKVTQENASFVDETASAASELADGVRQLRAMVDEFKV